MYNRYLSRDSAPFVPAWDSPPSPGTAPNPKEQPSPPPRQPPPAAGNGSPIDRIQQMLGFGGKREAQEGTPLRRLLSRFHLEDVDTGDLLLLILLFFLLEEKADDELLIALGILLIL